MIFLALTKPKKKLGIIFKLLLLALFLGVVVPYTYVSLAEAGAIESYMQTLIETESSPGEPIRVDGDVLEPVPIQTVWYQVRNLLTGEELITDFPVNTTYLP